MELSPGVLGWDLIKSTKHYSVRYRYRWKKGKELGQGEVEGISSTSFNTKTMCSD